jgi:DNA polymerase-3 subunit chi
MTRVDFYLLNTREPQARRLFACKLAEKAWRLGLKVYVQTGSASESRIMDDLLWTFRQGSFVPHALAEGAAEDLVDTPVAIGHDAPPAGFSDLLVNLGGQTLPQLERFSRLAEVVDQDEALRNQGRLRYRAYRDAGLELETHHIDAV